MGWQTMSNFLMYFFIFITYSIIGWIIESAYVSIKEKQLINRGFLIGPYCPIYGSGALGMILYLEQYKDNIITVFLLSVIICSILEYFTSYIMEKIFKARWWDYSNEKFNLNGRICGKNACLFGLGGVIVIYIVHPFYRKIIKNIPLPLINYLAILGLIIYIADSIISLSIIYKFKETINNIDIKKDSTLEFSKIVKQTLNENNKKLQQRLLDAFPSIDLNKFIKIKEIKELLKK